MPVVIGESRAQIECLLENGFLPDQIAWLPNFTPLRPKTEVDAFVRHHYRPEEKIVLFVGRASYEKGLHVLLEAAGWVKRDCRFVIITAGPLLEEIQSLAFPFGEKITVIPGLSYEETRKYYARSLVVVVPSVWIESFCLVGLEAYANMKPVIGSQVGGIKDWLKQNDTGWFVEPGDARDLAEKIDQALEYPERTQEMGRKAYDRACKYYSGQLYLSRLLGIYEKAIGAFHVRNK
jgi:glycosyltransferase involved in cell wall biosynthesis